MADQIKEISNGTYFIGALSDGVSIAGTDATTQYVVKDIYVQDNELPDVDATLDFVVNGVNVADIDSSATGSEIIDVSSTAVAVASVSFTNETYQILMPSDSVGAKINTINNRVVNTAIASSVLTQSDAITTSFGSGSQLTYFGTIGSNFYYSYFDGNSGTQLRRRAGGVNGTQTNVPNITSYNVSLFNGVDKFHWVTTSQIYSHNTTTNTNAAVNLITGGTGWNNIVSSNPRISFANGLVFWSSSSNGGDVADNAIFAINPTTGGMIRINGAVGDFGSSLGAETVLEVFYSGSTYYIVSTSATSYTRTLFVRTVADFGALSTSAATVTATTVYTGSNLYTSELALNQNWPIVDRTNNKLYFMSTETDGATYSYVYKNFDPITQTFGANVSINISSISPNTTTPSLVKLGNYSTASDTANKTNTTFYPQTATLRVTGVETTL